jgi:glycosyltransferase involved in cell wall biosynthesis
LADADSDTFSGPDSVPELAVPAARLSTALACAGHDMTVYVPGAGTKIDEEVLSAQGYRVIRLPGGSARGMPQKDLGEFTDHLCRAWERDRPDVVHAQSWVSGMASQSAARGHGIPVLQSFESINGRTAPGAETSDVRKLVSVLARRASWVAASNTEELFALLRTGCARSRISVIPCGVDSEVFTPPGPAAQRGELPHRIVSVWTSTGQMDVDTALKALAALPDTEFVLAVDPASTSSPDVETLLHHAASAANVEGRVTVAAVRNPDEIATLLRSADAYVNPAVWEPTGAAALMAMSCGVPVIGTSVGAMIDIVVDEVTGRLVPAGDVPRFIEAVRRLLHEPFAGRGMGAAGRDRARSRYSWDRVAGDAIRAYAGAARTVGVVSA